MVLRVALSRTARHVRFPCAHHRGMARKPDKSNMDPRTEMMRDILFRNQTPAKLELSEEEFIRHDTIHRAWQLHLRYQRERRDYELERQYNKMKDACTDLETHDPRLFKAAMTKDKSQSGFPIEMRSMTDTPPKNGWNHGWTARQDE